MWEYRVAKTQRIPYLIGHFAQQSPIMSGSFAEYVLQLKVSYGSSTPSIRLYCSVMSKKLLSNLICWFCSLISSVDFALWHIFEYQFILLCNVKGHALSSNLSIVLSNTYESIRLSYCVMSEMLLTNPICWFCSLIHMRVSGYVTL